MQAKMVFSEENGKTQVCPVGGCWRGRSCGWPHWNYDVFCHPLGLCIWSAPVSFEPGQLWAANQALTVWTGMLQGLCWLLRQVVVHYGSGFYFYMWPDRLGWIFRPSPKAIIYLQTLCRAQIRPYLPFHAAEWLFLVCNISCWSFIVWHSQVCFSLWFQGFGVFLFFKKKDSLLYDIIKHVS